MKTEPLALMLALSMLAVPALSQVPDNRGLRFNPDESAPPAYRETLTERDAERLRSARGSGESYIPTLHGQGRTQSRKPPVPERFWQAYLAGGRSDRSSSKERDKHLPKMIDALIDIWTQPPAIARVRFPELPAASASAGVAPATPRLRAGDGFLARTLHAVNSDYPGPVLLEILGPPLKGAVAAGKFTVSGERIVLQLDRIEFRGRRISVDAWAVAPDCACFGIRGEIDRHYVSRVLLPAAVRFAEGFLSAASRPAETLTLRGGDVTWQQRAADSRASLHAGLAGATGTLGNILLENAPRRATIRIPRNTELVVILASSEEDNAR